MTSRYLPVPIQGSGNRLPVLWVPPAAPAGTSLLRSASLPLSSAPATDSLGGDTLATRLVDEPTLTPAAIDSRRTVESRLHRVVKALHPFVTLSRWTGKLAAWAAALVVVLVIAGSLLGTWGLVPVLTGSMRPGIHPGDLVLVFPEPLTAVRVGQVIDFQPPGEGGAEVAHRIVQMSRSAEGIVIRTKGDANNVVDSWHALLGGTHAWRVRLVVPKLGYLAVAEHNPKIRLAVEALLLVGGVVMALQVVWSRPQEDDTDVVVATPAPST